MSDPIVEPRGERKEDFGPLDDTETERLIGFLVRTIDARAYVKQPEPTWWDVAFGVTLGVCAAAFVAWLAWQA